ncbi:ABC transporter substrate-binding protein [Actinotalea sp. K2]|uniref:ABC transporter substrate-binding protein n=1 Tax=Actinotalea sp. K2 TaxID=2939438 RepID=UPI00201768E2|nr:ABC transporter substrate-binding protein [Actinotalea sp. K2]MCL3863304.1 ABC transporter substrate-binding protein [Actinotalea sp. K2]
MGLGLGVALLLTACGGTTSGATDAESTGASTGGTLTIQTPWGESNPYYAPFEEIVAAYEGANPDVDVKVITNSMEQNQRIFTNSVLAGDAPDLIITNPVRDALAWVEQGATVPVTEYLEEWGLASKIYEDAQQEVNWLTEDGQLRGFPLVGFVWPTWYHSEDLQAAGVPVPATEEDVNAFVSALGGDGSVVVGGSDWSGFNAFLQTLQAYLSIEDLNRLAAEGGWSDNEDARKGVEWFVKLREVGFWSPDSTGQTVDGANAAFQGMQTAGITLISDYFGDVPEDLASSIELGGIPVPADANVDKPVVMAAYTASGVMISTSGRDENLDVIRSFVEHLYEPESIAMFVDQAGMVAAAEYDTSQPVSNALLAAANSPEFRDSVTFVQASNIPSTVVENLTRAASIAWTRNASAEQILEAMDAVY